MRNNNRILIFKTTFKGNDSFDLDIREMTIKFVANKETLVSDLFPFFDKLFNIEKDVINSCARFFHFIKNHKRITAIDNFHLLLFLELNDFNFENIEIEYYFGGIGGGEYVNDKIKFFIPSSEKKSFI